MLRDISLILHDLRSAENVGAIFRTAECAGVKKIYLTGYTPRPVDEFGRANKKIAKAALGAEKLVSWQAARLLTLLTKLKKQNVTCVAVEQSSWSIDYRRLPKRGPLALIFGNEVTGLSLSIQKQANLIAEIKLYGKKESLNVSAAAAIVLFQLAPATDK